ncbi:MAG: hypothetical protein FWD42_10070 [Solirubrobacterales bacterium]|nr:hypothetical protein [Solirubrobacterales bacterium]
MPGGAAARNGGQPPEDEAEVESWASLWPAVVEVVRGENALLGAVIAEARPVEESGGELKVAFASTAPFLKKKAEDRANRAAVASALERVAGRRVGLAYELRDPPAEVAGDGEGAQSEEAWVARVMAEFDAEELPGRDLAAGQRVGGEERAR